MEMQELEITIDNDGRVHIRVSGARGEDCLALTQSLEEAIGEVKNRSFLPEYFEKNVAETWLSTRNGR